MHTRFRLNSLSLALLTTLMSGMPLLAQSPQKLLGEGDDLFAPRKVDWIGTLVGGGHSWYSNDSGEWIASVFNDNPDNDFDEMIWDGTTLMLEGDLVPGVPNGKMDSVSQVVIDQAGHKSWVVYLRENSNPAWLNQALYRDGQLVAVTGDPIGVPGYPPGSWYDAFLTLQTNDSNQLLVVVAVDGPNMSHERALLRFDFDQQGALSGVQTIAKKGDLINGLSVSTYPTTSDTTAFNDSGDVIHTHSVNLPGWPYVVRMNQTILAQEGMPSPVPARDWEHLSWVRTTLTEAGDYAFTGNLDGNEDDDEVLIRNGSVYAREGGPVPGVPGFALDNIIDLEFDEQGNLYWTASWDDVEKNYGLFRNNELILQRGVDAVQGDFLEDFGYQLRVSDDGRYLSFLGDLESGRRVACEYDFGPNRFHEFPPTPGLASQKNTLKTINGSSFGSIQYVGSLKAGITGFLCQGTPLRYAMKDPIHLATISANSQGIAELKVNVPKKISGRTVYLQAADLTACVVSDLVTYTFP